jgi:hypothetical protein
MSVRTRPVFRAADVGHVTPAERAYGIVATCFPAHPGDSRDQGDAEAQLSSVIDELGIDLVVLARYVQILSSDPCEELEVHDRQIIACADRYSTISSTRRQSRDMSSQEMPVFASNDGR